MIVKLRGKIDFFNNEAVDIDVHGIVYRVFISEKNSKLIGEIGEYTVLHIYELLKEDSRLLFGFKDVSEREIFEDLLTVQGVGGKMALNVMSKLELNEISESILNNDSKKFTQISGVGNKLSLRIVNELKEKMKKRSIIQPAIKTYQKSDLFGDLVSCLENLGFPNKISENTADAVLNNYSEKKLEDLIPLALKHLSKPQTKI